MKLLLLAPQPFYTERGTPIAVRCLLTEFSRRGWSVDVLTYHEGKHVEIPNVRILRIPRLPGLSGIGPGFSGKKVLADILLFAVALRLVAGGGYRYIHAVEESAFMAVVIRLLFRVPFVYDMDSSVAEQMVEKRPRLSFLLPSLKWFESGALRRASLVIPVCESLATIAQAAGAARTIVLTDPPAFAAADSVDAPWVRDELGLRGTCFMYAGNLEPYQGIDLLMNAFAIAVKRGKDVSLLMIGGKPADVAAYRAMADRLGVADRTRFLGPKPLAETASFAAVADVLVSPRKAGVNTPMKIYAYLNAGKPILATDIESHSQVLTPEIAMLAAPEPEPFADGICRLADDPELRRALAERAGVVAREKYSREAFAATVGRFCQIMESETAA
jgi:glycosyltransferase involved in cell wall biosynthesis